jgi:hypothetical protein
MKTALENGESIGFSPFEVTADRLVHGGQFSEWADLRSSRSGPTSDRLALSGAV